jgi:hypothetical protein
MARPFERLTTLAKVFIDPTRRLGQLHVIMP